MEPPTRVPSKVEHHDASRANVPSTALLVAAWRAIESNKSDALVRDPFAAVLAGEVVQQVQQTLSEQLSDWVNFLAVRTKAIDDWLDATSPKQLVILGAGLDTRAYRLQSLQNTTVFEVDFAEVLTQKRKLLQNAKVVCKALVDVPANLATDSWASHLIQAGFNSLMPSCWLLEGLTGYLSEAELLALLKEVSNTAAASSSFLATFLGQREQTEQRSTSMHRFFLQESSDAVELLGRVGWSASAPKGINELASHYKRELTERSYFLVEATRETSKL